LKCELEAENLPEEQKDAEAVPEEVKQIPEEEKKEANPDRAAFGSDSASESSEEERPEEELSPAKDCESIDSSDEEGLDPILVEFQAFKLFK